ncbi:hypothetical protein BC834DRAFT_152361 [Gloeopeniophorella convolvens]|nr:hypothetical protein BC834DRAFT_152361 [Gloeopeniophorella convolvens]
MEAFGYMLLRARSSIYLLICLRSSSAIHHRPSLTSISMSYLEELLKYGEGRFDRPGHQSSHVSRAPPSHRRAAIEGRFSGIDSVPGPHHHIPSLLSVASGTLEASYGVKLSLPGSRNMVVNLSLSCIISRIRGA